MIRRVDLTTNEVTASFVVSDQPVKCLAMTENTLFVGSCDNVIKAWNLETLECKEFKGHRSWVLSLEVHGDYLYSCSDDRTIKVWDIATGRLEEDFIGHEDGITCLEFAACCAQAAMTIL